MLAECKLMLVILWALLLLFLGELKTHFHSLDISAFSTEIYVDYSNSYVYTKAVTQKFFGPIFSP